jgi:hypothetical protein
MKLTCWHRNLRQDCELADLAEVASQAARLREAVQDASTARDSAQVLSMETLTLPASIGVDHIWYDT